MRTSILRCAVTCLPDDPDEQDSFVGANDVCKGEVATTLSEEKGRVLLGFDKMALTVKLFDYIDHSCIRKKSIKEKNCL